MRWPRFGIRLSFATCEPGRSPPAEPIGLGLLILAAAGVVAGHRVAYWSAPHVHADGLSIGHDGHGYLGYLSARSSSRSPRSCSPARFGWSIASDSPRFFLHLVLLQAALFAGQEPVERAALGVTPTEVFTERVLWVGLGAQLIVGGVLLGIVRGTRGAISRLPALISRPRLVVPFAVGCADTRPVPASWRLLPALPARSSRLVVTDHQTVTGPCPARPRTGRTHARNHDPSDRFGSGCRSRFGGVQQPKPRIDASMAGEMAME